jgi:hypothetical protein
MDPSRLPLDTATTAAFAALLRAPQVGALTEASGATVWHLVCGELL